MINNVEKELNKFGKYLVKQSRTNLTKSDKKDTGGLYDSIDYDVKVSKNSFQFTFLMNEYGDFQDKGVKGVGGKKADGSSWKRKKVTNNSFKYTNKMPPAKAFNGWVVRKRIAPRRPDGTFASRKSVMYAIAKSIYHTGLETTNFFSRPFELGFKRLSDDIVEAFALDMDSLLTTSRKNARQ